MKESENGDPGQGRKRKRERGEKQGVIRHRGGVEVVGERQTKRRGKPRAPSVSGNNLMFAPRSFARVSQSYAEGSVGGGGSGSGGGVDDGGSATDTGKRVFRILINRTCVRVL